MESKNTTVTETLTVTTDIDNKKQWKNSEKVHELLNSADYVIITSNMSSR